MSVYFIILFIYLLTYCFFGHFIYLFIYLYMYLFVGSFVYIFYMFMPADRKLCS